MSEQKYGFVYLWFDKKHKRFYVGCHWGTTTDGYVCSSRWMRNSYNRRRTDFKRRILAIVTTNKKDLLAEEYRWLSMIKPEELKNKYYNVQNRHFVHWSSDQHKAKLVAEKYALRPAVSEETRQKMSKAKKGKSSNSPTKFKKGKIAHNKGVKGPPSWNKGLPKEQQPNFGKPHSKQRKQNISKSLKGRTQPTNSGMNGRKHSEETKIKISESKKLNSLQAIDLL